MRPALRKAGRTFPWAATLQTLRMLWGNNPYLGKVRPALRKAGRTLGAGLQGSKKCRKMKVLRMTCSIVENVPTPRKTTLKLFLTSQLTYRAKTQKMFENSNLRIFSVFFYIGPRWSYCLLARSVALLWSMPTALMRSSLFQM